MLDIAAVLRRFRQRELDEDELLRALLGYPSWHVSEDAGQLTAMAHPIGVDPEWRASVPMRGRELPRNGLAAARGIVFEKGLPHEWSLPQDALPRALELVSALDVEECLESPAPDQSDTLLGHPMLVLGFAEGVATSAPIEGIWSLTLFTSPDVLREFLVREPSLAERKVTRMTLPELARSLGARVDFDAVWINPLREPRIDPWAPGCVPLLAAGIDPRPEARIVRARSVAEIHALLDQEAMAEHDREHRLEYFGETTLVAHYTGTMLGRRAKSYRFEPVTATAADDPLAFGKGVSELLCAGHLLEELSRRLALLPEAPPIEDREYVEETLRLACELVALVGESEEIPRSVLRTVRGARFVRKHYDLAKPSWIRDAYARAQRLVERCER